MILNLKSFNANITQHHFKMTNIWSAIRLMKPGCYRSLSQEALDDLKWWVTAVPKSYNLISHGDPHITVTTDASLIGCGCSTENITSGGNWIPEEAQHDINYLEMLAVTLLLP